MTRNRWLKPMVWILCLLPLALLLWDAAHHNLTANPILEVTHRTGLTTLILLLVTLAVTPVRRISGLLWLIQYRRLLGLFAFFYACLHLLVWVVLDQFFNLADMLHDIAKRPFITMGMLGWALLVPLAVTSTQGFIRRLGKKWALLHRLAYVCAAAGVIHFYWLVKKDVSEPLLYAAVLAILLGYRLVYYLRNRSRQTAMVAES